MTVQSPQQPRSRPVAVWLNCAEEPPSNGVEVVLALCHITEDTDKALGLALGRDETSVYPWKGVVAAPVSFEAAEVIVKWLASVGAEAVIDDGYYDDDGDAGEGDQS